MNEQEITTWIKAAHPKQDALTNTVVNIIQSLLVTNDIDCLAVTGRTKTVESIREKIKRKSYNNPAQDMTDISGIRIIAYFESDISKISELIEQSFNIDTANSLSKDSLLATDQIGYRSVHYVCDLGDNRASLPEFSNLSGLKFEFQIRTVLQHAWAELAHDRNYKFSGKLPKEIERKLYLYAGMLEIADKGFDELSSQIDEYILDVSSRANKGDLDIEINSISLEEFINQWAIEEKFPLEEYTHKKDMSDLVEELNDLGIYRLEDLKRIIPDDFSKIANQRGYSANAYALLRDLMLIHDYKKYHSKVSYNWIGFGSDPDDAEMFSAYLPKEKVSEIYALFDCEIDEWYEYENG